MLLNADIGVNSLEKEEYISEYSGQQESYRNDSGLKINRNKNYLSSFSGKNTLKS